MASAAPHIPPAETASSSLFDWSDFLDFNLDETLDFSFPQPEPGSGPEIERSQPLENSGRVRKRDPRLVCSNFLAGRVPCACPELDEQLAEEESALPGKKRARMARVPGGTPVRCQVPGCEVDITELKGYHKRHRVCLRCANASAVVLDGESKRYCQQCGK
ncbi:UNVERIFIED_CONTAM: Squamosa promoter-binding-like protein 7 [Sesamum latifolium]